MKAHLHLYIDESRESKAKGGHILLITILTILIFLSSSRTFDIWTPFLHMTISNSVFERVKHQKDILRCGRNASSNFILWKFNLKGELAMAPRNTLWAEFLDHDLLNLRKFTLRWGYSKWHDSEFAKVWPWELQM